ncbi:MAG: hypothetical protein AABZ24_03895, partial [Nitrospirota bacterium]
RFELLPELPELFLIHMDSVGKKMRSPLLSTARRLRRAGQRDDCGNSGAEAATTGESDAHERHGKESREG